MRIWTSILLAWLLCLSPWGWAEEVETNAPPAEIATNSEPTIVTSEHLSVDYARNVGVFERNVLVVDPRITLRADKMTVEFGATSTITTNGTTNATARTVRKITAEGGVVIVQAEKKATGDQAVYTADDGKVVLTGKPQVESPEGTVSGEKITFWRDEKRMVVDSGSRLVLYPEEFEKKEKEKAQEKETKDKQPEAPAP